MKDLKSAEGKLQTILLVDWTSPDIPLKLILAGFTVFSYSPEGYTQAMIKEDGLIFQSMTQAPEAVDLVSIYRPAEEHANIIRDHVLPLGAKIIWLQPPVESAETGRMANENGLIVVQGEDIRKIILRR